MQSFLERMPTKKDCKYKTLFSNLKKSRLFLASLSDIHNLQSTRSKPAQHHISTSPARLTSVRTLRIIKFCICPKFHPNPPSVRPLTQVGPRRTHRMHIPCTNFPQTGCHPTSTAIHAYLPGTLPKVGPHRTNRMHIPCANFDFQVKIFIKPCISLNPFLTCLQFRGDRIEGLVPALE
jgi:hypothetical protein